jgi:hypothetical protein
MIASRGRADHHPECVGADQVPHLGLGHAQVLGHVGHQAHDGKFAGADGETAKGQSELDQENLHSGHRRAGQRNSKIQGVRAKPVMFARIAGHGYKGNHCDRGQVSVAAGVKPPLVFPPTATTIGFREPVSGFTR